MKANFPTYKEIAKKAVEEALDGYIYQGKTLREWVNVVEQWQDLKETIIEARDGDGTGTQQEICKFLANYMDVLEKNVSSSENPNKWIPVSERLPEEREWYLAVFKEIDTGYQLIPRVADYIGNGENKWRIIDEDGLVQEYRSILECVAWMPLPEPYKESEEK